MPADGLRAVILAGGRGTRLRPYTAVLPKPLVPIGERPVIELIVRQLAGNGFERVDISVGHLGHLIRAYFDQIGVPDGIELHYWSEESPLGTAGALREIDDLRECSDPFLVMNGDILTTLDFAKLMHFHRGQRAALTIATRQQSVGLDLGVIEADQGLVTGYVEKPSMQFDVSMGVYAYSPTALDHIPHEHFDFPDLVHALIEHEQRIAIYPSDETWFDIGTVSEHERAAKHLEEHPELFDDV